MKLFLPIILMACYHFPIEYTAHNLLVKINCYKCDTVIKFTFQNDTTYGFVTHVDVRDSSVHGYYLGSPDDTFGIKKIDSSFSWLSVRAKELDDSIVLIQKQNRWLDSFNHTLDTVHWVPYYQKLKRQK